MEMSTRQESAEIGAINIFIKFLAPASGFAAV